MKSYSVMMHSVNTTVMSLFNDQLDQVELHEQCLRYFSNILTPFAPLV
ncbi:hypothetical protein OK016_28440 [Vibrio chagasii]|nr:hypothetical protein [Vibrio chagasii]